MSGSGGGKPTDARDLRTAKENSSRERLIERELGKIWDGTDGGKREVDGDKILDIVIVIPASIVAFGFAFFAVVYACVRYLK